MAQVDSAYKLVVKKKSTVNKTVTTLVLGLTKCSGLIKSFSCRINMLIAFVLLCTVLTVVCTVPVLVLTQ